MDGLLDENNVFFNVSAFDEASLILRNEGREKVFDPIGNDFGYYFVTDITKRDGSKTIKGDSSLLFGDKGKKGRVGAAPYFAVGLGF